MVCGSLLSSTVINLFIYCELQLQMMMMMMTMKVVISQEPMTLTERRFQLTRANLSSHLRFV